MSTYTNLFKNKIVVLATFLGTAFLIFSPSAHRIFLSDDYCTLNNIVTNQSVWLETFFRPVGDLTLLWTYKLAGWDPFYFYLVNILLHTANSFLLYLFCLKWYGKENRYMFFAVAAGLIFLTYPSHLEAVLWAIGRGISLAVFFALLAMITVISNLQPALRIALAAVFYFLALGCYESVLLLPVILLYLYPRSERKQSIVFGIVLAAVLAIHVYLRYLLTGGMWRAYNGVLFSKDIIGYVSTFVKIVLRMFVPPFDNPLIFTISGIVLLLGLFIVLFKNRNRFQTDFRFGKTILLVVVGLACTIIVALSFGLSTRTSEGDRLLYFPSIFYAMLIVLLAVRLTQTFKVAVVIVALLVTAQTAFVLINQNHWIRASAIADKVINSIGVYPQRPLYIVNLPSDYKGAYVLRNCLPEALLHYGVDTSGVRIVNIIQSTEVERREGVIAPEKTGTSVFIWPQTIVGLKDGAVQSIKNENDSAIVVNNESALVLYWNKKELVPLKP